MAAAAGDGAVGGEFGTWLAAALHSDDPVIVDYVTGIVGGDESEEEQRDALEAILAGLLEDGVDDLCQQIFAKWRQLNAKQHTAELNGAAKKVELDDQLSRLMEKHNIEATVHSSGRQQPSLRDSDVKAAILKQYAEISDTEEEGAEEERGPDGAGGGGGGAPARNTNREEVAREEQERREKLKAEAAAKRDKDKQDREKQKAQQAERKEKEKKRTIKGEKRR